MLYYYYILPVCIYLPAISLERACGWLKRTGTLVANTSSNACPL